MSEILTDLDAPPVYQPEPGEHEPEYAHIVRTADLMHSQLTGEAIWALCGHLWIPVRNPDDYPLCSRCADLFARMGGSTI